MDEIQSVLFRAEGAMKIKIVYEPDGSWMISSPSSMVMCHSSCSNGKPTRESALEHAKWLFSMEKDKFSAYELEEVKNDGKHGPE